MPKLNCVMKEVASSQIHSVGHDPDSATLYVRFRNKSGPGKCYAYPGVTPDMHAEFMGAESLGVYFGQNIKGATDDEGKPKFPHSLIVEQEEATDAKTA